MSTEKSPHKTSRLEFLLIEQAKRMPIWPANKAIRAACRKLAADGKLQADGEGWFYAI